MTGASLACRGRRNDHGARHDHRGLPLLPWSRNTACSHHEISCPGGAFCEPGRWIVQFQLITHHEVITFYFLFVSVSLRDEVCLFVSVYDLWFFSLVVVLVGPDVC